MVNPNGIISTIAGTGGDGYTGEGVPATASYLATPSGLAVDASGNVFISMAGNRIMKVATDGTISTVAGTGQPGYAGDCGAAVNAQLNIPMGIALDGAGNLYVADSGNNAVRMLSTASSVCP
jgi:sugar lactone lactonase YvrE